MRCWRQKTCALIRHTRALYDGSESNGALELRRKVQVPLEGVRVDAFENSHKITVPCTENDRLPQNVLDRDNDGLEYHTARRAVCFLSRSPVCLACRCQSSSGRLDSRRARDCTEHQGSFIFLLWSSTLSRALLSSTLRHVSLFRMHVYSYLS